MARTATRCPHDSYFVSGTSGRLSLPLGDNLSIQQDVEIEITGNAYEDETGNNYIYSYQMGSHLSFRDPGMGLIGAFGWLGVAVLPMAILAAWTKLTASGISGSLAVKRRRILRI